LSPNLSRGRGKSIGGDLIVDDEALNKMSTPYSYYTMALLVINPCANELTSPGRLNPYKRNQEHKQE
jgi:hypothetical protein